ncbi:MAG: T9SS type A sorting domain-containing protein, partial [Ignavibacteria bacterium]
DFRLHQNFPNPFNPKTQISYDVLKRGKVKIEIIDLTGKILSVLTDKELDAGSYETSFNGNLFSSGAYICRMNVNGKSVASIRMLLIK